MTMQIRGLPACSCLAEWIPAFEQMIGRSPRLFQLVGDAEASAGFHRGGGSADYEPLSDDELRTARNMGGAAWNRWWTDNFHCHIRLNGCPHNTIAQPQVADLNAGRDGTGPLYDNAGEADKGPRNGVHWPLRTWREGIDWANKQMEDDMANSDEILAELKRIRKAQEAGNALTKRTRDLVLALARAEKARGAQSQAGHDESHDKLDELIAAAEAED